MAGVLLFSRLMKICIVLDSLIRAGAERQAVLAIGELCRQGYDADLVYYNQAIDPYEINAGGKTRILYLPKRRTYLRFLWKLTRFLRRGRYDVVHAFLGGTTLYVSVAGRLARVPVVFGGIRAEYDVKGLIRVLHRICNRLLTGWIVNSNATVRSMLPGVGATPDRVHVVYNGIDPTAFASQLSAAEAKQKLGIPAGISVVLIVARLTAQKNIHLFLEMAADVTASRPSARFVIAGDGELRSELEAYSRELRLSDRVLFLGNRADIPDILRAADVLTLTSHYEGMANTLLEAMAVGLPFVSTAYAGVEELVTHDREGLIVPLRDRAAMTGAVLRVLDDPDLAQRMGEAGRETVTKRFTIKAMGARMYSVYRDAFDRTCKSA